MVMVVVIGSTIEQIAIIDIGYFHHYDFKAIFKQLKYHAYLFQCTTFKDCYCIHPGPIRTGPRVDNGCLGLHKKIFIIRSVYRELYAQTKFYFISFFLYAIAKLSTLKKNANFIIKQCRIV